MFMLVLGYVTMFLPYTIQYVTGYLNMINENLYNAGRTFGATKGYVFLHITLPLVFKGTLTGWMMTFIISFRELVASSLLSPPGVKTVSTYIMNEFDQGSVSNGMCMAFICVLLTTTSLILLNKFSSKNKVKS